MYQLFIVDHLAQTFRLSILYTDITTTQLCGRRLPRRNTKADMMLSAFGKPGKRGDRFSGLHNEIKKLWSLHQKVRTETYGDRKVHYGPLDFVKKIISLTDSLRYDDWTLESGDMRYRCEEEQMFSIVRQIRVECGFIHLPIQFCQIHRLKTRKSATWNLETFRWCLPISWLKVII